MQGNPVEVGSEQWVGVEALMTRKAELIQRAGQELQRLANSDDIRAVDTLLRSSPALDPANGALHATLSARFDALAELARQDIDMVWENAKSDGQVRAPTCSEWSAGA